MIREPGKMKSRFFFVVAKNDLGLMECYQQLTPTNPTARLEQRVRCSSIHLLMEIFLFRIPRASRPVEHSRLRAARAYATQLAHLTGSFQHRETCSLC